MVKLFLKGKKVVGKGGEGRQKDLFKCKKEGGGGVCVVFSLFMPPQKKKKKRKVLNDKVNCDAN